MGEVPRAAVLRLDDVAPTVDSSAWVAPGAVVVGDVVVRADSSLWYGCVIRADDAAVRIGAATNLQDGVVVHADPGFETHIGDRVTVGHGAIVHGARVHDDCIIGMRAVLLNGVEVGRGSIVAAGAVVREGTVVPPGSLVAGVPAAVRRDVTEEERQLIADSATEYVDKAVRHRDGSCRVDDDA